MPTFDRFVDKLARVGDLATLCENVTGKTRGRRPVNSTDMRRAAIVLLLALIPAAGSAQTAGGAPGKPRVRALGIRFDGTPGSGFLEGPIAITNTHSVGVVRDAIIVWQVERNAAFQPWSLPVVAETYDGYLNDINGFHVKPEHVFAALGVARVGGTSHNGSGDIFIAAETMVGRDGHRIEALPHDRLVEIMRRYGR